MTGLLLGGGTGVAGQLAFLGVGTTVAGALVAGVLGVAKLGQGWPATAFFLAPGADGVCWAALTGWADFGVVADREEFVLLNEHFEKTATCSTCSLSWLLNPKKGLLILLVLAGME